MNLPGPIAAFLGSSPHLQNRLGEFMFTMRNTFLGFAAAALAGVTSSANAADTGTLKMTFVYGGAPPTPALVDINKDKEFCGKTDLKDEKLIVNPKNGGIKNVIFYVYTGRGGSKLPEFAPVNNKFTLANDKCRFEPHIVIMQTGDTLTVTNPDEVGHNANMQFLSNAPQNFQIPPGGEKSVSLEKAEPAPIPVDCNIHPWMKSYVVVADHPFVGISNEDGVLEIKGLPVGKLTFRLWHENADGSIKEIKVGSKKEKLSKNNIELNIKAGENDLGKVEIAAGAFSLK